MTTPIPDHAPTALQVLGIPNDEEKVYRWLLDRPGATVHVAAESLQLSVLATQRLFDGLEEKGLLVFSPQQPRRYVAAAPDIAIEALALKRQEELQRARGVIRELQEKVAKREVEQEQLVELLTSREAQRQVFEHLQSTAVEEVVTLVRLPVLISRLDDAAEVDQKSQRDAQRRGVRYRAVVDADYLEYPGAMERVRDEMNAGEEIRVVSRLPLKFVIADRRLAFIPLGVTLDYSPSLFVRSTALVDALYALFELLWERAMPLAFDGERCHVVDRDKPDDPQVREILTLMSAGFNDKAIAYEMDISASTLHRRIGELMTQLDARSRFQLGWAAARRFGSVDQPG